MDGVCHKQETGEKCMYSYCKKIGTQDASTEVVYLGRILKLLRY
jgi:hypothetical protein